MMETTSLRTTLGGMALLPFMMAAMAQAQEGGWDITPRVSVGQIYTDNVELAPPGEENDESITELDAGFTVSRETGNARARIFYNLQALGYWEDSDQNDVFHQFAGDGTVGLVPEYLFVDAAATYRQRLVSREGAVGDNINITGNRADVATFRLSPFLVQRFGDTASGELRYVYDRVAYQDEPDIDLSDDSSESNRVLARVDSGPAFTRIGWGLTFERTETDFDDGSAVTFQQTEALVRWNLNSRSSVFAAVGDERNDFEQDPRRAQPDDTFWRVGASLEPAPQATVEGYFGERFFGRTYGGNVEYRFRSGRLFANYDEGLTTASEFDLVTLEQPAFDPDGRPVSLDFEVPDVRTGVYLSRRFTGGFSGERSRLRWGARIYDDRRDFLLNDTRERVQGIGANVAWQVRPRTRIFADGRIEDSTFADIEGREDRLLSADLGISRDLGPRTVAVLSYGYRERDSSLDEADDYRENRITARVIRTF